MRETPKVSNQVIKQTRADKHKQTVKSAFLQSGVYLLEMQPKRFCTASFALHSSTFFSVKVSINSHFQKYCVFFANILFRSSQKLLFASFHTFTLSPQWDSLC